ncbi:nitroreductase family protein [Frateuria aurantia]
MAQSSDPWLQRYGVAAPVDVTPQLEQLLQHRSIRQYLERAVSDDSLLRAVAAAQSASTSSNLQLWSVLAIRDPERKLALARLAGNQRHVRDAPLLLAWVADVSRLRRMGERQQAATEGSEYLEAFVLASVDAALAAQNAAVSLESEGLGLVYIGGMRNQPEEAARLLNLPEGAMVLFGMCVGYPDPASEAAIKPRLSPEVVLHRETYSTAGEAEGIAEYQRRAESFQQGQGRHTPPWSQQCVERMADGTTLTGRDRLKAALRALGFALR